MEQVPAEFVGARICYFDRKANVGQNVFKSISCPEKLRAHLNGNDWDYDQGRIFEFTLVNSELTRVDTIPFAISNVNKFNLSRFRLLI